MKWKKNYEEFGVRGAGGTLGDIGGVSGGCYDVLFKKYACIFSFTYTVVLRQCSLTWFGYTNKVPYFKGTSEIQKKKREKRQQSSSPRERLGTLLVCNFTILGCLICVFSISSNVFSRNFTLHDFDKSKRLWAGWQLPTEPRHSF